MKEIKINGATQINIFGEEEKEDEKEVVIEEDELDSTTETEHQLNDAGEEISVENGYAPADVEELEEENGI